MQAKALIFFQLFESTSSTFTYLLGDRDLGTALLIDPVLETVERDWQFLKELNLKLKWILETHVHADHITGAGRLCELSGAKVGVSAAAGIPQVDLALRTGDTVGEGAYRLSVLATPGHTDTCLSFYGAGRVFTGDALMIRGTGRTDFQQGSAATLFESIQQKLFTLPDDTLVYPAHDYRGFTSSTIGLEKAFNPRVGGGKSKEEYIQIMKNLKLAPPKRIAEAVPANLKLGVKEMETVLSVQMVDGVPAVQPEEVHTKLGRSFELIDVRRPEEFCDPLGHIPGARLVTLGPDLMRFLNEANKANEIIFVCRSGGRSGQATALSRDAGFTKTANLVGGMLRWNELGLPTDREQ